MPRCYVVRTVRASKFLLSEVKAKKSILGEFWEMKFVSTHVIYSGVFRIWQREGHGERAEREPITGVWGRSPQRGPGAEPLVGGSGSEAP